MSEPRRQSSEKTPRPGGRPRSPEPSTSVCTWLPARAHDRLIQRALQEDKTVSQYVREIIILTLR